MLLKCSVGEDSWESLGKQGDPTSQFSRKSALNIHWKDWGWSWNSNTLATWCKELTHWKRPWCWERLKVGTEGVDRGWDGWMASLTWWTWVWVNSELVMDRESWHPTVYGVAKSWTWLSYWTELISTVIQSFSLLRSLSNIYWPHTGCYATRKVHSCDFTKMHRRNHLPEKTMLLFEI